MRRESPEHGYLIWTGCHKAGSPRQRIDCWPLGNKKINVWGAGTGFWVVSPFLPGSPSLVLQDQSTACTRSYSLLTTD